VQPPTQKHPILGRSAYDADLTPLRVGFGELDIQEIGSYPHRIQAINARSRKVLGTMRETTDLFRLVSDTERGTW